MQHFQKRMIARHYTVGFALEQGLYNLEDEDETLGKVTVKNMNLMVSLGYDF